MINPFDLVEDDAIFLIGCIDELDPEHQSETWRFATEAVLPTCIVGEDLDLAFEMLEELEVMLTFLQQLSRI
jgi:hypothetical protein